MAAVVTQTSSQQNTRLSNIHHIEDTVRTVKPIDDSVVYTVNDLLVRRAQLFSDVSLLSFPASQKGTDDYVHYTASSLDRFADEAARRYMEL